MKPSTLKQVIEEIRTIRNKLINEGSYLDNIDEAVHDLNNALFSLDMELNK
jgi:hypothetical protein